MTNLAPQATPLRCAQAGRLDLPVTGLATAALRLRSGRDRSRVFNSFALTVMLTMSCLSPVHAIITSDEPGSHIVTPGVPAFGVHLEGVAALSWSAEGIDLPLCSGVLIGDRDVLTGAHCIAGADGTPFLFDPFPGLEVRAAFDAANGRHLLALVEDQTHYFADYADTGHDLAVVRLAEVAPAFIPRYPVYIGGAELGQPIVVAGYGLIGHGATGEDPELVEDPSNLLVLRAGLNHIEAFGQDITLPPELQGETIPEGILFVTDFDSGQPEHNFLEVFGIGSDLGFGADEVSPALGDSGGPAFLGSAIVGIMSLNLAFDGTDATPGILDASWGEAAVYVRTSAFRDFLSTATEGRAVFVPEPSAGWPILLTAAAAAIRHRRKLRATDRRQVTPLSIV